MSEGGKTVAGGTREAPALWPEAWRSIESELRVRRGGFAAIDMSAPEAPHTLALISDVVAEVVSIGSRFAECEAPPNIERLIGRLNDSTLLTDIEVLFTPQLELDVVSLLRQLGRRVPLVVAWPGRIATGRFRYSQLGRSDYVDVPVDGALLLHPLLTQFPDETPYAVERTLA